MNKFKERIFKYLLLLSTCIILTDSLTSINPLLSVGKDIYCQFDEYNNTNYGIKKSGQKYTTVYKVILPTFTAKKAWTIDGNYINETSTVPHGATAPENYIPVKEGEKFLFKLFGVYSFTGSDGKVIYITPICFLDDKGNFVGDALTKAYGKCNSALGLEVTVPPKATRMHITNYNNQGIRIHQILNLTDEQIDKLPLREETIKTKVEKMYDNYIKDRTLFKKARKGALIFSLTCSTSIINDYIDFFINQNTPLSVVTNPESFPENCKYINETRLDVIKRLIKTGKGEAMPINSLGIEKNKLQNYTEIYRTFIKPKQYFLNYGLDADGLAFTSITGQTTKDPEQEKWISSFFAFSDRYGTDFADKTISSGDVYYITRVSLNGYQNDTAKIKLSIDSVINERRISVFYFSNFKDIDQNVLKEVINYAKEKEKEGVLDITLLKDIYKNLAMKESDNLKQKRKFYVSSTGRPVGGLSPDDPVDYDTLRKDTYFSGDTILFKNGDTFYGVLNIKIKETDNSTFLVTNYGDSKLPRPTISGYKIVDSNKSWEKYKEGDNIYSINLKDLTKFKGVQNIDNATNNIGFLQDDNGVKYAHLKFQLEKVTQPYDYFCDETYLYIKTKGKNPYDELGTLRLSTKRHLILLHSYMKVENLRITGSGAHGMSGSDANSINIEITNNIIEDIGGSKQHDEVRFGNSIEFWETDFYNLNIHHNILRNTYDSAFTIQGHKRGGSNAFIHHNLFIFNTQDNEIFGHEESTEMHNYDFSDNLSINQGKNWGMEARPDKGTPAFILFFTYNTSNINNTKITFHDNYAYNPSKLYHVTTSQNTDIFFRRDKIKSDNNTYYLTNDTILFKTKTNEYHYDRKDEMINDTNKDHHSKFILIEPDEEKILKALKYDNFNEIKSLFITDKASKSKEEDSGLSLLMIILIIVGGLMLLLIIAFFILRYCHKKEDPMSSIESDNKNIEILPK